MKQEKNIQIMILILIIFIFIFNTLVYSAITSTMKITGTASSRFTKDIRITNFKIENTSNNVVSHYEEFNKDTLKTSVTLPEIDSYITYKVEVTNYGNVEQGILSINNLNNNLKYELIDYTLKDKINNIKVFYIKIYYSDYNSNNIDNNIIMNFDFRSYHKINYEEIPNNNFTKTIMDGDNLVVDYKSLVDYVKVYKDNKPLDRKLYSCKNKILVVNNVTSDLTVRKHDLVAVIKGTGENVGDMIKIEDEEFYVIKDAINSETITMISKYDLYTEGYYNNKLGEYKKYENKDYILQHPIARGFVEEKDIWDGIINFSTPDEKGITPTSYKGSILYNKITKYHNYIENLGVVLNEARPLTVKEAEDFGCIKRNETYEFGNCDNAPSWLWSSSFWLGESTDNETIWYINTASHFKSSRPNSFGAVRPVITIPKSEIPKIFRVYSGTGENIGDEVVIGSEHFYVLSSPTNTNTLTLMSKYNLYVGGEWNQEKDSYHEYGEEITSMQREDMKGYVVGENIKKGTIPFSNDIVHGVKPNSYEGSLLEKYVLIYKQNLERLNIVISNARLARLNELTGEIGCSESEYKCLNDKYSWIYGTTYWLMTTTFDTAAWGVGNDNSIDSYKFGPYNLHHFGLRPVIEVDKNYFK